MAIDSDFIVKGGLQVTSNIVVGHYSCNTVPISNGIISSGNVGIGTNVVGPGSKLQVIDGNISLNLNSEQTDFGIVFSDGTIQRTAPPTGAFIRTEFIAYEGQTNFEVLYTPGYVDVYYNGILLSTDGYISTGGTEITFENESIGGDLVVVIAWQVTSISEMTGPTGPIGPSGANTSYLRTEFVAYIGQTIFHVNYVPGYIDVYYNGTLLSTDEYTVTNGSTVVLLNESIGGDPVVIISWLYAGGPLTGPTGPPSTEQSSSLININSQTNNYIIQYSDLGNVIIINNSNSSIVTVQHTLPGGFHTTVLREGVGSVTILGSGVNVYSPTNNFSITAQYGTVNVLLLSNVTCIINGSI